MKTTLATAFLAVICIFYSQAQSIDSISGPRVWLSGDHESISSIKWPDRSFFKNDATVLTALEAPAATGAINFNRAVVFDGIDDYLKIPYSFEGLSELAVLAVFHSSDTTERGIWGTEGSASRNILLTTRQAIGPDTIGDSYGKTEKITVLNSVMQNWDNTTASSSNSFVALGSAGKNKNYKPFKGSLAELIVFNRALTFLERVQYETYLAVKYGTGLQGGNFVSSGEKVLWHGEHNIPYGNHIAGLGRDDFFNLYQKQSGSAYDSALLLMTTGTLTTSNVENKGIIADQDFILWGSNGLPLTAKRGEGADSVLSVVQRKWLVTATGNTASKLNAELYVDASRFPATPLGYWLVIDRSGTGNFSVDNLEYILPDRISNGRVIYKNVLWDTDLSGKDNFGFAQAHDLFAIVRKLNDPSCTNETAGKIRIDIIAGKAPYQISLTNTEAKISRDWKQSEKSSEQKELVTGTYSFSLTDADKESVEREFTLVMPDALYIDLGADQRLTNNKDIVLDISTQVPDSIPVSYEWESNFGFSSTENKVTIAESGLYRVFVTKDKDGCVFTDEVIISGAESQRVAVYPSIMKSDDRYNVSVSLQEPGVISIRVFNSKGIQVYEMEGSGQSEYQFISSLKDSGMYLVVIQSPNGMETRKIVIN
jgi:hypothetical protein